jgi:hypothetical protein
MSLYLAIFEDDDELEGLQVGFYSDFGWFRNAVTARLEGGRAGSRFPTLILHSDCDGEWTPREAARLERELVEIAAKFRRLPPAPFNSEWQRQVARECGLRLNSLYDCFFDVDGEPLIERLIAMSKIAQARNLPILFQ